jgi:hypothetical protein
MSKDLGDFDLGKPATKKYTPKKSVPNTRKPESASLADLNFKVSPEFRREFKMWASANDMSQKAVLEQAFEFLKQNYR